MQALRGMPAILKMLPESVLATAPNYEALQALQEAGDAAEATP
jgi:hypothetical protein